MTRKRLCYVIGTRPEVIRSAGILRAFEAHPELEVELLNTGQHFDPPMMADLAVEVGLPSAALTLPVRVGVPGRRFAGMTGDLVDVLGDGHFDAVVVYGDTDSSLAGALAGIKTATPVVHVEAGCRSGDMRMQEEMNRRLIDHVSALHLAVSDLCAANLKLESVPGHVVVTGDPQFDVFSGHRPGAVARPTSPSEGFVTLHRAENVDHPHFLVRVLAALEAVGRASGTVFTWAAHPRTAAFFADKPASPLVRVVSPLSYGRALEHLARSSVCVTDSGGLQKEAFWLRTPCITMRPTTEWLETVEAGANVLCPDPSMLHDAVTAAVATPNDIKWEPDPYGGYDSSKRVAAAIAEWLVS